MKVVLVGKLAARRRDRAPVAGISTLNRLELSRPILSRYHKISHDPAAIFFHGYYDGYCCLPPTCSAAGTCSYPSFGARTLMRQPSVVEADDKIG